MTVHLTDLNATVDLLLKRIPGTLRIGAPLYADASLPKKQAARDLQLRAEAAMLALERGETPPLAVGEPALDAE